MLFPREWGQYESQVTGKVIAEKGKRGAELLKDFISSMQKVVIDIAYQSFYFLAV